MRRIFPDYPDTSGSVVSQRRINQVKPRVIHILRNHETDIRKAFETLATRRRKRPPRKIEMHFESAIAKVENAKLCAASEWAHGESDDTCIWIPANKLNDTMLMGTILHESLHYIATFDGKDICTRDEHLAMKWLGENI